MSETHVPQNEPSAHPPAAPAPSHETAGHGHSSGVSQSFLGGEGFNKLVAVLIVTVTVLATVVGFLEHEAGIHSAEAKRDALKYAVQAMGVRSTGYARVGFDYADAYRNWAELNLLATQADNSGRGPEAEHYRAVRDRIGALSPLLNPPYLDPAQSDQPNTSAYEADIYVVTSTVLSERFTDLAEVDEAWVNKGDTYMLQLSLLAASLALFGLAMTMFRSVRSIFVLTGAIISVGTLIWIVVITLQSVKQRPEAAIDAYAKGVGLSYQNKSADAISEFNAALQLDREYGNALYERGNAEYDLGEYDKAVEDYQEARAVNQDNTNVNWNLGWTLYLQGNFEEADQVDLHALQLDPSVIAIRMNRALALLASGQIDQAKQAYATASAQAAQQVADALSKGGQPPDSLWADLDGAGNDLQNLIDRLNGQSHSWTEAPDQNKLAQAPELLDTARLEETQIKDLLAALENTGQPAAQVTLPHISALQFGMKQSPDEADYTYGQSFPYGATEIGVRFDYQNLASGQPVMWKVYIDGEEDPSLRLLETWQGSAAGNAATGLKYARSNVFAFAPGQYRVELYVDWHLVQTGEFTIQKANN